MIFLSHSWSKTTGGKNIHDIVSRINNHIKLQEPTWFDEEQIVYDIDGSIVRGITKCSMFVSFLTKSYIDKVCDAECNSRVRDNCYKEFSYAQLCKKPCVAVILEKELLNVSNWRPGIVKLYLGNKLYIDGTSLKPCEISNKILERYGKISSPRFITNRHGNNFSFGFSPKLFCRAKSKKIKVSNPPKIKTMIYI
tara:strand:- start:1004 stop:1588 length:585 start_codon:yes stop_codon:yes gene_type:complete